MKELSTLGSIGRGIVAGAVAIGVFRLFFRATRSIGPRTPFRSGPPAGFGWTRKSERPGLLLDYAAGVLWGGLYGAARERIPALASPLGAIGAGTAAWLIDDDVIAPALGLAPSPRKIPLANHVYAAVAHLVLGAALVGGYEQIRCVRFRSAARAIERRLCAEEVASSSPLL